MVFGRNGGLGLGVDRLQADELHQPTDPLAVNLIALAA